MSKSSYSLLAYVLMPQSPSSRRPSPRKMPRQARSEETVRIIIEAAAHILERKGLGDFTTNAVAERAGVSIGSLYQYFPGKEALIAALIVRETSILLAECEQSLAAPTGRAALSGMIEAAVAHQLRRPVLARLLDIEEARLPLDEDTQRVTSRFLTILREVLSRHDLPPQPQYDMAAQDVMAIVKGMVDTAGEKGERDRSGLVRRVSRAVYGYLNSAV
ncbi:Transcriptional regulator, TetR family [Granulibacter bethesdensis]|nr:Transcriptional regulator, TetR family [Granulibacter bethesdensis]